MVPDQAELRKMAWRSATGYGASIHCLVLNYKTWWSQPPQPNPALVLDRTKPTVAGATLTSTGSGSGTSGWMTTLVDYTELDSDQSEAIFAGGQANPDLRCEHLHESQNWSK